MLLEVAVAAPIHQTLTYSVETETEREPGMFAGRRVLVPLGSRRVTGYVLGPQKADTVGDFRIKKVVRFLDDDPLFHHDLIPFFRWIASYYLYPVGLVIQTAMPSGLSPRSRKQVYVIDSNVLKMESQLSSEKHEWAADLLEHGSLTPAATAKILSHKKDGSFLRTLTKKCAVGLRQTEENDAVKTKMEPCCKVADQIAEQIPLLSEEADWKEVRLELNRKLGLTLKLSEAKALCTINGLSSVHGDKEVPLREARAKYSGTSGALPALLERSLVIRTEKRIYRSPTGEMLPHLTRPKELTKEQQSAMSIIRPALQKALFHTFLLHGVTGCGKTEIYLRSAEECLKNGRDVLILVPEIALATQTEAHFVSRFGDKVVLMHSGLSASERFDQFSLALTGKARIVIGARSAIFAPLRDPGLIVVDEEHDGAYKQEDSFRYNGRDIAVLRGRYHKSVVLLGSATPSVTSYSHTVTGKYTLIQLHKRVAGQELPEVNVIDLNLREKKKDQSIIGPELHDALCHNLEQGKQSILLMNRRGFSTVMICKECGTAVQCDHCHVSLTLHKGKNRLLCHYCGFSVHEKVVCNQCRSPEMAPVGFGTERVEEDVTQLLPNARVKRIDADVAADRKKFLRILGQMKSGDIDILIGTQMIAKGLHFPEVTVVGVVWADGGMNMPDFRASERTYQLISQVTGRAGRGSDRGRVFIQTMRPDHYALTFARDHDYQKLYEQEMQLRRSPRFPPYVRMTLIRVEGRVEERVRIGSQAIARYCRAVSENGSTDVEVLGPAPSPLDKIRDNYRWQVLIKSESVSVLGKIGAALLEKSSKLLPYKCRMVIDVDPENMM